MVKKWEPKTINHTELKAKSSGIIGPFMVLVACLALLFGIAAVMYAFAGMQLGGKDLVQVLLALDEIPKRFAALERSFNMLAFWPFLVNAIVPSAIVVAAAYVLLTVRRAMRNNDF